MGVSSSPELFINMRNVPRWNEMYGWEDQTDDVKQFFTEEARKVLNGVTINGVYITPWLYWHINFFPVFQDLPDGRRVPMTSQLRDNEWFFAEMYQRAREEKKGLAMFGTRRFGKALLDSEPVWTERGPKPIGTLLIGDRIYDDKGVLSEVIGVYPQGRVDVFRVTFSDGRRCVCSGDHIWRVWYNGSWRDMTLSSIIHSDFRRMSIPLSMPVMFRDSKWPVSASLLAQVCAGALLGVSDVPRISDGEILSFFMTSEERRRRFVTAFIRMACGVVTDVDEFEVVRPDRRVLRLVMMIFWSLGYYCSFRDGKLYMTSQESRVGIESIEPFGKARATCIEVDNASRMFLAGDFLVTHNTTIMSSLLQMNATMTIGLSHSVVGFSEGDLANIGDYTEYGLDHVHPFFRINRTSSDWSRGVILGKRLTNNTRDIHATITITNINMGKRSSTQKAAGQTPYTAIFDEIGKGPIKKPFTAAIPSYDTPYGWRVSPILAGTGGEVELSQDAQEMLADPESYNLVTMDWDLLNRRAGKGKTWKERKWGMFVPGQMSMSRFGVKRGMGLGEYLGKPDKRLDKISILATDFEESTERLTKERDELSSRDRTAYTSNVMFYPFSIDDCFLSGNSNKFPVELAIKHKNDLMESGNRSGMCCEVFLESGNKMGVRESNKALAGYPFKGGIIDSPVQIFEMPVSNRFDDYIYTCGLDFYKQREADTDSLGAFYVFKRLVGIRDPYANRIVASYVSRPPSIDAFCRTCEVLQRGYGALCLMENADQMYEQYLNRKSGLSASAFLFAGEEIASRYVKSGVRQKSKLGLSPTPGNQNLLISTLIDYCWQDFVIGYDEANGMDITVKGIELIDDIALLDEIIQYDGDKNVDRIVAYSHALVLARYYDDNNYISRSRAEELNAERREDARRNPTVYARAFSSVQLGPF